MKAISLWQPWASLWLTDAKRFETRHWPTNVRGWILVHAAKKLVRQLSRELDEIVQDELGCSWPQTLPTGALIGAVNLTGCYPTGLINPDESSDEFACGDWTPGRFAWERDIYCRKFISPIPWKGRQGFFLVPDSDLPPSARLLEPPKEVYSLR